MSPKSTMPRCSSGSSMGLSDSITCCSVNAMVTLVRLFRLFRLVRHFRPDGLDGWTEQTDTTEWTNLMICSDSCLTLAQRCSTTAPRISHGQGTCARRPAIPNLPDRATDPDLGLA